MITGRVTEDLAIQIPVVLQVGSELFAFDAILDTGFDDYLSLPFEVIDALQLPFLSDVDVTLADGSHIQTGYYQADLLWDGIEQRIPVLAANNQPLLGMLILNSYRVCFIATPGATVTIEKP